VETIEISWSALLSIILGPTAGAWVAANRAAFRGVQTAINGTKESVKRIEVFAEQNHEEIRSLRDDVLRLQGRHDSVEIQLAEVRKHGCSQLVEHTRILRRLDESRDE